MKKEKKKKRKEEEKKVRDKGSTRFRRIDYRSNFQDEMLADGRFVRDL